MGLEDISGNSVLITQGQTYRDTIVCAQKGGGYIDLTGATVVGEVRRIDGTSIGTVTCTVATPASGKIERVIAPTVTDDLLPSPERYVWGVRITMGNGDVLPEIQGEVSVKPRVVGYTVAP